MPTIEGRFSDDIAYGVDERQYSYSADLFPGVPGAERVIFQEGQNSIYVEVAARTASGAVEYKRFAATNSVVGKIESVDVVDADNDGFLDIQYRSSVQWGSEPPAMIGTPFTIPHHKFAPLAAEALGVSAKELYLQPQDKDFCARDPGPQTNPMEFPECEDDYYTQLTPEEEEILARDIEWRVQQLEWDLRRTQQDVRSLEFDNDRLRAELAAQKKRADAAEARLAAVDERATKIDERVTKLEQAPPKAGEFGECRDDEIDSRFDELESRVDEAESDIDDLESRVDDIEDRR